MHIAKLLGALLFTIILGGCASKASYDYDTSYDFSQLQSFHVQAASVSDELMASRIDTIISDNLTAKSFVKTDSSNPDFTTKYLLSNGYRDNYNKPSVSLGAGTGGSHISTGLGLSIPIGKDKIIHALKISIHDQTGRLIWQGEDSYKTAEGASPEKTTAAITQSINKILASFPPSK